MSERNLWLITEIPGFTPQIGRLVSMMNYVRSTTLSDVAGLGVEELDYLHDSRSNSIGTLLSHITAAEVGYQVAAFLGRGLDEEERQEWGAALDLGESARREIRGHELEYYVTRLERVRAKTLGELGLRTHQWLEERTDSLVTLARDKTATMTQLANHCRLTRLRPTSGGPVELE